jgi:hypothetical protein
MKNKFHLLVLTVIILLMLGSCWPEKNLTGSDYVISPLSDTTRMKGGTVVYALPMTIFTFEVQVERIIELPGPYAEHAEELLGIEDVVMNENEYWSILNISVNSHEETDPSEYYVIESNNIFHSNVLALKKEGLILDLNPELEYKAVSNTGKREVDPGQFRIYDLGSDEYYRIQTDTAFRRVNVDTAFIRIPYIVETKKKLTVAQLAERAARRLIEIREGKILILTGEANVFPQDDAAINELNRLEKEYTELFTGKTITERQTFTYQLVPRKESEGKPVTLFKFSEVTGPGDTSSEIGTKVIVILNSEQKTKDLTYISSQTPDPFNPPVDKLFYRIPDVVNMLVKMEDEILYKSRKLVYQFGEILQLPGNYLIGK